MPRPNKIWFRQDVGWWMVTLAGKKIRLAKGRENKHQAEQRFHELMLTRHQLPQGEVPHVADLVESFLAYSERRFAPDTYRNYRFYGQKFAEACGRLLVTDLKPFHVTRWIDTQAWNQTTEGNARRVARRVMTWAMEEGLISFNPLARMKAVPCKSRERALTPAEFKALMSDSHGPFRILLWALRNTGARPSEVYRLTWDQVHSDRWILTTHKTRKKTRKVRVIYLSLPMQRLMQYLRTRSNSKHVFLNTRGRPWTNNSVQLKINRIKAKHGLAPDICAYLLRHTFGTHAVLSGLNSSVVAELLGHTSTEMVDRVYVHLADQVNHLRDAVNQATRIVARPPADDSRPDAQNRSA